jgi:transposase
MREKRTYRTFSPAQRPRSCWRGRVGIAACVTCAEYEISETLYDRWRDRLPEGGKSALTTPRDKGKDPREGELRDGKKRIAQLERALGKKTYELEVAGELLRDWMRASVCPEPARWSPPGAAAVVARVAGISRQAIDRPLTRRPAAAGSGDGRRGDAEIVEVAKANPTDTTRMVAALA